MRLASIHSGKPMVDIVRDPQYLGRLTQYHDKFMFDWGKMRTIEAISRKNCSYKADMIIIDSESQLDTKERSQDEHHSKILKDAKRLAMEQNCMVVLITRMNRDKKSSEKPSMNMLKGSSSFEYDCDVIFFLYNKDKGDRRSVTCLVDKNREGGLGEVELQFKESITTFEAYNEN
jgi:replicative DNA helicase